MWTRRIRVCGPLGLAALLVALGAGCDTAPPGAGLTNGPEPEYSPEKPAVRTDMPPPEVPDVGLEPGQVSSNPEGGTGSEAGTGGRSGGQAGVEPADAPGPHEGGTRDQDEVPATPPTLEGSAGFNAAGSTVPQGDIKGGTPKTPR